MSVGRICTRVVATATKDETARDVADRMAGNNVGSLIVVDDQNRPVGMVTDRDLVTRVMAARMDPDVTTVNEAMTKPARTVEESTPIEQALTTMRGAAVRRLVVVGAEGRLVGVITVDDVLQLLVEEAGSIGAILRRAEPRIPASA